ncbi:MAG: heat-inducible transcription repressor HrcA [Clostridiales bacterium]|nr:heat-inducible transcription repressor HrcA [Clostridiales bacterium]
MNKLIKCREGEKVHELDDRKLKILEAIIQNYLETGEPVGSRTISKYTDLNLSSATIRNEMSDLEEMGYITQPHTSAGRIPTDKGYRLYVDLLLLDKNQELENMREILIDKADRLEHLLQHVAKLLAANTNYATMVTTPQYKKKVKFIQLTEIDEGQLLAVIVFDKNIVKNKIIKVATSLDKETLLKLNIVLNTFLQGLDLTSINLPIISQMKEQAGEYREIVNDILEAIVQVVSEGDDFKVYTSGATNILRYPELSDIEKASELLYTFEEKKLLSDLIQDRMDDEESRGIQVYIGNETPIEAMKDCSVVTATYEIEEGVYGKVGIIGPKRMDYERVVGTLQNLMVQLDDIFKNKT